MKNSAFLSVLIFILLISGCSTHKSPDPARAKTVNNSDTGSMQKIEVEKEKYVQVLNELISNGCNISNFEMVDRSKVLDMKIACK